MTDRPISTLPPTNPPLGSPGGPLTVSVGTIALPPANPFLLRHAHAEGIKDLLQEFLPAIQGSIIMGVVQGNFERLGKQGLEQALLLGQKGVVLKVEALVAQTETGAFYSIRGGVDEGGVHIIGIGPDANSVCASYKCHDVLEPSLSPGVSVVEGSGYVFLKLGADGKVVSEGYEMKTMNQRSRQIALDDEVRKATLEAAQFQALSDYSEMLQKLSMDQASKAKLDGFIAQRLAAKAEYQQINRTLIAELEKARRASQLSKTLALVSGVLTLASAVSMVTAQLGEAPQPKDPSKGFVSFEELVDASNQMARGFNDNINALQKQVEGQGVELERMRKSILDMGKKLGRDPDQIGPLRPML